MRSNWFVSFFSTFFLDAHGVSSSFTGVWVGWTALSRFFTVSETLKQEGFEFATSLVYKVRPCLKIIREQRKVSYGEKERGREEERRKELLAEQRKQKAREEASCWGLLYLRTSSLACHMEIDRTWDSCLRSKTFYYSLHNSRFMFTLAPLASQVPQEWS